MAEGMIILNGLSTDQLMQMFGELISEKVQEAVIKSKTEDLMERFLSVSEVQNLFVPAISRQTIHNWSQAGTLNKHVIAGKVYYKYSEILQAVKSIKRFSKTDCLPSTQNPSQCKLKRKAYPR